MELQVKFLFAAASIGKNKACIWIGHKLIVITITAQLKIPVLTVYHRDGQTFFL